MRFILRWALSIYFVEIKASGQERIRATGPLIFAANHPNSIMDTVILGSQTKRQIQYMAKSGLFKNPLVRAWFNHFGVIPVYRAQDPGDTNQNESSFRAAYQVLEEGGCIGIFPEGENSPDRVVQKLKTGTARIALEAEAKNSFGLGIQLLPVGLNFEDRDRFLSSVLIKFGKPIDVRDFKAVYKEEPQAAIRELTEELEKGIKDLATHIEDERNHQLVVDILDIYGSRITADLYEQAELELDLFDRSGRQDALEGGDSKKKPESNLEERFEKEQFIADAIEFVQRRDPGMVARVRMDVRRYYDHLSQLKLRHELVEKGFEMKGRRRDAVKLTAYGALLGPVAIYGLLNNIMPSLLVKAAVAKQPDEAMIAFAGFFTGFFAFPLFYFLQAWGLWWLTGQSWVVAVLYVLTLPPAGLFFLRWWQKILAYRERILVRTLFRTEKNLLNTLEQERLDIIETFEALQAQYGGSQRSPVVALESE